jgi:Na+/melibiose symporter-like transporter
MNDEQRYQQARARVQALRQFYTHLAAYILINTALLILNLLNPTDGLWFIWPLFGWGIGMAAHALNVFSGRWLGNAWEEQEIRKFMDQER